MQILTMFSNSLNTLSKSSVIYTAPFIVRQQSLQWQRLHPTAIKGVIFNLGGTALDAHVIGPAVAFQSVFEKQGVRLSISEAREPMGLPKKQHIAEILKKPSVQARWLQKKTKASTQEDIDSLYKDFVPTQLGMLKQYSTLTEGTAEAIHALQSRGIKIGCSTGFTEEMVKVLLKEMADQKVVLDAWVASDTVQHGARPSPHMIYKNMDLLGIDFPGAIVKVGDTEGDIGEGLSANTWTVAVYGASNYTGIESLEQLAEMPAEELKIRQEYARDMLERSGAHYVIETMKDLPKVIELIELRIKEGETPNQGFNLSTKRMAGGRL